MSRAVGNDYEDQVAEWLLAQGCTVICRNWYAGQGELDIVAQSHQTTPMMNSGELLIVEVKGRRNSSGWNRELISSAKSRALRFAAEDLIQNIEAGQVPLPEPMSGMQFVLISIVNHRFQVIWNALDGDIG